MKQQIKGLVKTLPAAKRLHCSRGVNDRVSVNCAFHYSLFGQFKGIVHPKMINVSFINPHVDKYNKSHFDSYTLFHVFWSHMTEILVTVHWKPCLKVVVTFQFNYTETIDSFFFYKRKKRLWILKDIRVSSRWKDFRFLGTISLKLSLLKNYVIWNRNKWLNKWQPTFGVDPSNPSFRMTVWIDFRRAW